MLKRVEERLESVVERVIVGERHGVDADLGEQLGPPRAARGRRTVSDSDLSAA